VRIDRDLFAALRRREDAGGRASCGCRDLAVARQLFATREELGTFTFDRGCARLLRANEIAHVRFESREPIGGHLVVASRTLRRGQPLIGLLATSLGLGTLRENVPLRALGGDELLVQSRSHRRELRGGVALGALPRVDDASEAGQHEQTARRDHRAGAERRRRSERGGVIRRDEDGDPVRDAPAPLRRGGIPGRACTGDRDGPAERGANGIR